MSEYDGFKKLGPHIAVPTKLATMIPFPIGTQLWLVYGPEKYEIVPTVLSGVTRRGIEVRCACGQEECSRVGKAVIKWEGSHPYQRGM